MSSKGTKSTLLAEPSLPLFRGKAKMGLTLWKYNISTSSLTLHGEGNLIYARLIKYNYVVIPLYY
jgi:hypothetical protein